MTASPPRYRQLADLLRADISSGKLKPGDQLPTEMEICASHSVSRYTAREALRLLSEDGLIERRRGAGTVVADTPAPAFAQPIGDFDAILQYARDAVFVLEDSGKADDEALAALGLTGDYIRFSGLRRVEDQLPLAVTTIYAVAAHAPHPAIVATLEESVSEWIEREHSLPVERVVQRMEAVALEAAPAKKLGVKTGTPALRTIRRYRDASGRVMLLSESLHPAGRFAYEMRLERKR